MIQSIDELYENVEKGRKIIVLYSGGLDGTFLLAKLKDKGYTNISALHIDIEGSYSYAQIFDRLEKLGVESNVLPLTDEFLNNYVLNSIHAYAKYLGGHPLSASLSRPLIVKHAFEYINQNNLNSAVLLHTSNNSQNSLRRFNNSLKDLGYKGLYGSPYEKTHISRSEKLMYLNNNGIAFDLQLFSEDSNIWCREFEYGDFENIENANIPEESFVWTRKEERVYEDIVNIEFRNGIPVSLNNESLSLREIILIIRKKVGKYGIGRFIGLEEIHTGAKVLEVREAPSAALLMDAYKNLELATINSETSRVKSNIEQLWVREASEGRWFGQLRQACDSFCREISFAISGSVTYKLSENQFQLISIRALKPNYIINRDKFEEKND